MKSEKNNEITQYSFGTCKVCKSRDAIFSSRTCNVCHEQKAIVVRQLIAKGLEPGTSKFIQELKDKGVYY